MKTQSKYSYQKRIKDLEEESLRLRSNLEDYRSTVLFIYDGLVDVVNGNNTSIKVSWLMQRIRRCLK